MDASSWLLIVLTLVVGVVLLPQLVRSRRLMGMARTEDRFSGRMRLLDTAQHARVEVAVQPRLHQQRGGNMERPVTGSVKLSKEIWRYNQLRAARQAAITTRRAAASRRAALALGMMVALVVCLILGLASVIGMGWLGVPSAGLGLICGWGVFSARAGRVEDAKMREEIRQIEKNLAASPAGRRALQGARRPLSGSGQKWVAVAQAANRQAAARGANQNKAQNGSQIASTVQPGEVKSDRAELSDAGVCTESIETTAGGAGVTNGEAAVHGETQSVSESERARVGAKKVAAAGKGTPGLAGVEAEGSREWTPIPVPPPTYTLLAAAPAKSAPVLQQTDVDTAGVRVPLRPKTAQYLPADEALSAAELNAPAIDLEQILSRRRAAGA